MTEQLFIKDVIELIWKEDQPGRQLGGQEGSTQEDITFAPKIFLWVKRRTHLICENKHQFWISEKFLEGIINTNN